MISSEPTVLLVATKESSSRATDMKQLLHPNSATFPSCKNTDILYSTFYLHIQSLQMQKFYLCISSCEDENIKNTILKLAAGYSGTIYSFWYLLI